MWFSESSLQLPYWCSQCLLHGTYCTLIMRPPIAWQLMDDIMWKLERHKPVLFYPWFPTQNFTLSQHPHLHWHLMPPSLPGILRREALPHLWSLEITSHLLPPCLILIPVVSSMGKCMEFFLPLWLHAKTKSEPHTSRAPSKRRDWEGHHTSQNILKSVMYIIIKVDHVIIGSPDGWMAKKKRFGKCHMSHLILKSYGNGNND